MVFLSCSSVVSSACLAMPWQNFFQKALSSTIARWDSPYQNNVMIVTSQLIPSISPGSTEQQAYWLEHYCPGVVTNARSLTEDLNICNVLWTSVTVKRSWTKRFPLNPVCPLLRPARRFWRLESRSECPIHGKLTDRNWGLSSEIRSSSDGLGGAPGKLQGRWAACIWSSYFSARDWWRMRFLGVT